MAPVSARAPVSVQVPSCIIAIGASGCDGLAEIKTLLAGLPDPLAAVVLVVLHRPWDRLSHLRDILARASHLPVVIAADGDRLQLGSCYIGEPAEHLTLAARSRVQLLDDPTNGYRNRTIDALFRSVAAHAGSEMIGVVLSGSLDDGSRGLAAIKAAGGTSMVLTPNRRGSKGMPENAINYDGPIDKIGTPEQIAEEISHLLAQRSTGY
jgi:two-component system, chemotaxis family, protein-glutamate methylesterase/glutaminase